MASEAPPFWWQPVDWRARILWPVSALYGVIAARRMHKGVRKQVDAPVLCIGNFTVGGTGKTPTAITFAKQAAELGFAPGFLSRGHGGASKRPHLVDAAKDSARHVGDEPLLLAAHALVAVTPDRAAGAKLLIEQGCDFLIMDDGFQSARVHVDYALAIADARHGLGNGRVIPAGPLRAPMADQLRHVTALLRMGEGDAADSVVRAASRAGKPVFEASVQTVNPEAVAGRRLLAFAGIGHPERFYNSLATAGGEVAMWRSFGDHHIFSLPELMDLQDTARDERLDLVTTSKDAARLRHAETPPLFMGDLIELEVEAVFEDPNVPRRIIDRTVAAWKQRRLLR